MRGSLHSNEAITYFTFAEEISKYSIPQKLRLFIYIYIYGRLICDGLKTRFLGLQGLLADGVPPFSRRAGFHVKQLVSAIPATPWNPMQCVRFPRLLRFCRVPPCPATSRHAPPLPAMPCRFPHLPPLVPPESRKVPPCPATSRHFPHLPPLPAMSRHFPPCPATSRHVPPLPALSCLSQNSAIPVFPRDSCIPDTPCNTVQANEMRI